MNNFNLKVLSAEEKIYSGKVLKLVLPTTTGEITILNNHAPLISVLSIGEIKIVDTENVEHNFLIQGGVIDIKESSKETESNVVVLVDKKINEYDIESLDAEIERAKQAMQMKQDEFEFAEEQATIERSLYLKKRK